MIVEARRDYKDLRENRWVNKGDRLKVDEKRAKELMDKGLVELVSDEPEKQRKRPAADKAEHEEESTLER